MFFFLLDHSDVVGDIPGPPFDEIPGSLAVGNGVDGDILLVHEQDDGSIFLSNLYKTHSFFKSGGL